MERLRVYEYARSQQISSKEVIEILKRLNIPVANHMSVMDQQMMNQVEAYMAQLKSTNTVKPQATQKSASTKQETPQNTEKKKAERPVEQKSQQGNRGVSCFVEALFWVACGFTVLVDLS